MNLPFLRKKQKEQKSFFLIGLSLFVIGFIGGAYYLYNSYYKSIDAILGDDLWFYSEVDLSSGNLKKLSARFDDLEDIDSLLLIHNELDTKKLTPWIREKLSFGLLNEGHFIGAAKYKNLPLVQDFMNSFLLSGETLGEEETSFGKIYIPSYSSQRAFTIYRGWLIWSDSKHTLMSLMTNPETLSDNTNYKKIRKDLPKDYLWLGFMDIAKWQVKDDLQDDFAMYRPLIASFGSVIPALGITLGLESDRLILNSKALAHEEIYQEGRQIISNTTIPDLAQFTPKNNLLFLNGSKVFDKYQHTKDFLKVLDPQLSLVFEGIIQAQSNELFGKEFDYEDNLLAHLNQNYAILIDFENRFNFGFVAQIENSEKNKLLIKKAVLAAQTRFEPEAVEIELPDGTKRTELVAKDISTLPIEEKKIGEHTYYIVKGIGEDHFSYAFVDHYFVFANTAEYLEKMISTFSDPTLSLAENRDFSQSVLFDFEAAESYGFLSFPKFFALWDWFKTLEAASESMAEDKNTVDQNMFLSNWKPHLRNMVFSKVVYPESIYIQGIFFLNR